MAIKEKGAKPLLQQETSKSIWIIFKSKIMIFFLDTIEKVSLFIKYICVFLFGNNRWCTSIETDILLKK